MLALSGRYNNLTALVRIFDSLLTCSEGTCQVDLCVYWQRHIQLLCQRPHCLGVLRAVHLPSTCETRHSLWSWLQQNWCTSEQISQPMLNLNTDGFLHSMLHNLTEKSIGADHVKGSQHPRDINLYNLSISCTFYLFLNSILICVSVSSTFIPTLSVYTSTW